MLVKERVANGSKYLDENYPGWYNNIDISTLDMTRGEFCIGGQLEGSYSRFVDKLTANDSRFDLGFAGLCDLKNGEIYNEDSEQLREEWIKVILSKQIDERIGRGVEFLDNIVFVNGDGSLSLSRWYDRIDEVNFDIDDSRRCVLGKLFLTRYSIVVDALGKSEQWQKDHGFLVNKFPLSYLDRADYHNFSNYISEYYNFKWMEVIRAKQGRKEEEEHGESAQEEG